MEDVLGIKDLTYKIKDRFFKRPKEKIKGNLKINVSAACFVPKPFTPFQWAGQNSMDEFYEKARALQREIKDKKISFSYHEPKLSYLEAVFARGAVSYTHLDVYKRQCTRIPIRARSRRLLSRTPRAVRRWETVRMPCVC